ncbi:GNAT family N-acetyltransferase [Nonomuraea sediminis]|uniref:GNAT family N-acetyltransferase n=1 Tax=Nonomuraea sediminis TaxID=2835864 RepID=UPI001BDC37F4|nr:GNAT family N-acetyltransferase [Nonomuraea sediminis]
MEIRVAGSSDVAAVLGMFDSAVAWLVAQGRTGQWGSEPFTGNAKRTAQVEAWVGSGGMRIAEVDGQAAGCVTVGAPVAYVEPAPEPELYVQGLVTDQRFAGRGVGRTLLEWAGQEARRRGVGLLRVDCYAGDDGKLVTFYESCGFVREAPFTVGTWPGQVLQRRIA